MAGFSVQVTIPSASGVPADSMVNHFYFTSILGVPEPGTFDNVIEMLKDFYVVKAPTSTAGLTSYMSTGSIGAVASVKIFNLNDPKPRVPYVEATFNLTGRSTYTPLPSEVALCASWKAAPTSGVSAGRLRNRIYLGGFANSVLAPNGRPSTVLQADVVGAMKELHAAADASASFSWKGYSPTAHNDWDIAEVWCDNAWDTQRRRGLDPSSRISALV